MSGWERPQSWRFVGWSQKSQLMLWAGFRLIGKHLFREGGVSAIVGKGLPLLHKAPRQRKDALARNCGGLSGL